MDQVSRKASIVFLPRVLLLYFPSLLVFVCLWEVCVLAMIITGDKGSQNWTLRVETLISQHRTNISMFVLLDVADKLIYTSADQLVRRMLLKALRFY